MTNPFEIIDPSWHEFDKVEYPREGQCVSILYSNREVRHGQVWRFGVTDWQEEPIPVAWKEEPREI